MFMNWLVMMVNERKLLRARTTPSLGKVWKRLDHLLVTTLSRIGSSRWSEVRSVKTEDPK